MIVIIRETVVAVSGSTKNLKLSVFQWNKVNLWVSFHFVNALAFFECVCLASKTFSINFVQISSVGCRETKYRR